MIHIHHSNRQMVNTRVLSVFLIVIITCVANSGCMISSCNTPKTVPCDYHPPSPIEPLEIRAMCCPQCQESAGHTKVENETASSSSLDEAQSASFAVPEIGTASNGQHTVKAQYSDTDRSRLQIQSSVPPNPGTEYPSILTTAKKPVPTAPLMPNFR